ncbi:two-component regulator propeller domain-containing protein [Reichenbachiella sp. MSK19-1]|uniref:hybrid sensor histidine kinase/response regulator transcription factor n=1 Tax=Reichenbachiella sp. MSK19-1 TaxID=1897631 RepID=UPI000E6C454F|nr:two-component regulator propeller domain-containing protein [Reichenbachiella sp. MSK19-1]RJE72668.1 hypothetical protein BGP76_01505 [Reichenbachiella sp. MSK19-1]
MKTNKQLPISFLTGLMVLYSFLAPAQELYFSTLSMRDGLPTNIMAGVTQDQYDFIWVSTGSGLARYDGNKFTLFKKGEADNTLPSNELTSVVSIGDYIWVGSWDGLCKVNVKTFEITRVDLQGANTIRTLHVGQQDVLWVGTAKGLIRYDLTTDNFERLNNEQHSLSHNMVRSIYEDQNGTVWVGTYDGLNLLKKGRRQFEQVTLTNPPATNQNHLVLDIKPSINHDPNIWIGTELGLYRINTNTLESYSFTAYNSSFSNPVIKWIYPDTEGKLWLGTDFGLNIFDPITKTNSTHFHNPQLPYSIANNVVIQIFEDKSGVIWFVTSNGLSRVNKYGNFYTFHDITYEAGGRAIGNQIKSFLISRTGDYWLATQHGVIQLDPHTGKKKIFNTASPANQRLLLDNVSTLEEDQFGQIWIGTASGINIWDEQSQSMTAIKAAPSNGLQSNYIGNFTQQDDGTLWVSAWQGGLYKIEGDLKAHSDLRFKEVSSLASGSEKHIYGAGYIWTIEYDQLYRVHTESLESTPVIAFNKIAANRMIYTLYCSDSGEIWAGTLNGLIQYDPSSHQVTWHPFLTDNDEIVTSIIEDDAGNIWSVTNSSLQKLSATTKHFEIFPLDHNLPIKSFYFGCVVKNKNGQILFGGDNGFISFVPNQATPNAYIPSVYITDLDINNRHISIGEELDGRTLLIQDISFVEHLELDYDERSFALQFSSLDFWQPNKNLYTYRLEGFEDNWHQVSGANNLAIYSNVKAGDYTFVVRAINYYGLETEAVTRLQMTINPPLFLNGYFITLYIVMLLVFIYYALKTYSTRVHLKNQLQITRLEVKHAEEIERTKEVFFTNISHELRTPISLILPPIHQVQHTGTLDTESKTLIALAEKNAERLLRLVNQILDFNKMENDTLQLKVRLVALVAYCEEVFSMFSDKAQRGHIHFLFEKNIPEQEVWIDAEKVETVLFNLLSNAFKFTSREGFIKMTVSIDTQYPAYKEGAFKIEVSDSGVGISEEDQGRIFERFYQAQDGKRKESGSGIGLTLAAEYVALHHGNISVKSSPGMGTSFTVHLPLGKTHLPVDTLAADAQVEIRATPSVHGRQNGSKFYQLDLASDKPLVLIIEDNNDMVDFIRTSLNHKYNFVAAENGQEGLLKANNFLPQVIISDIMMPIMDGLTLCKEIKNNPKTSHVSVILLTAKALLSHRIEGIKTGADAYITKPFEIELLEAHIDQLIQRKKELTEFFRNDLIPLPSESQAANNEDNIFVKRVMDIIEANIANSELTVDMISSEMAMSSTHLYRKLKANTDHSAKEIIQKYRLKKASLLLQNKEGNITEIMYQVGFSSLSYFSKCFKSEFGLSPKKYQERFETEKKKVQ